MKSGLQKIRLAGLLGFTLLWIFTGCAQMRDMSERPRKGPAYYEHKVKWTGESLSIIAKWYTGSFENWKVLAKINPGMDPNRIQMGEKVRIPENLMKTKKPMPESFVASLSPEKKKVPPATPEPKPSTPKKTRPPSKEIKAKPPVKPAYYEHKVRWSGESLSIIAKWYTGSFDNWKTLAKANPKINPSRIYAGQKIRIPENLLKTREPMPKSFLADAGKRKREAPPSEPAPPQPPPDEEEPQLFGPKPYPKK